MENIETPNWVKEQLLRGEKVISKLSHGTVDYYATDKRLLRFRSRSDCDVLEYGKMSITFTKYGLGTSIIRAIAVLLGVLIISIGIFSFVGPTFRMNAGVYYTKAPFVYSLLLWVMGLFLIMAVLLGRYAYYRIEGPDFDKKDLKKWRIVRNRWGGGKVDRFAKIVKERSGRGHG